MFKLCDKIVYDILARTHFDTKRLSACYTCTCLVLQLSKKINLIIESDYNKCTSVHVADKKSVNIVLSF